MNMEKDSSRQGPDGNTGRHIPTLAVLWRKIIIVTFAAAAVGGAGAMTLRTILPKYETSGDVAIIPTDAAVAIDKRFDAATTSRGRNRQDERTARRAALIGLVHSGDLATRVVERLDEEFLEGYEYPVGDLLQNISARLVTIGAFSRLNQSDLIRITFSADSPEKAAAITNIWMEEYTLFVNKLYERVPQPVIIRVRDEVRKTEMAYVKIQNELEDFLSDSESAEISHAIEANIELIDKYKLLRHSVITTLVDSPINSEVAKIVQLYDRKRNLDILVHAAQGLLFQIENGGDASVDSNALAISILKLQIYTIESTLPENLDLEIIGLSENRTSNVMEQIADTKSIIVSLKKEIAQIDQAIDGSTSDLSKSRPILQGLADDSILSSTERRIKKIISNLESENKELRKKMEKDSFKLHNLTQQRDLIRSGLETLRNEQIELQLTAAAAPSEVRMASPAIVPRRSAWPSPVLVAAACGTVALAVMIFLVVFMGLQIGTSRPLHQQNEMEKPEQA